MGRGWQHSRLMTLHRSEGIVTSWPDVRHLGPNQSAGQLLVYVWQIVLGRGRTVPTDHIEPPGTLQPTPAGLVQSPLTHHQKTEPTCIQLQHKLLWNLQSYFIKKKTVHICMSSIFEIKIRIWYTISIFFKQKKMDMNGRNSHCAWLIKSCLLSGTHMYPHWVCPNRFLITEPFWLGLSVRPTRISCYVEE